MEAMRHASHGTTTRVQQELYSSRAQLEDAARASQAREGELDGLRRLLAEAERSQQQTQARLRELRTELDASRTREHELLRRAMAAERKVQCQEESVHASVKVGYISRACQEFMVRCPTWTQSNGDALLHLSREDALTMLNTVEEFDALCSDPSRQPVYLDSSSDAVQFRKAYKACSLLLQPDKIAAEMVPHRSQRPHAS